MKSEGFHFGGHSLDHPLYFQISEKEQIFQTIESVIITKKLLNEQLSTFAFPFTDYNIKKSFFDEIHKSIVPTFGCAGFKTDIENHFQRIGLEENNGNIYNFFVKKYIKFYVAKLLKKDLITNT